MDAEQLVDAAAWVAWSWCARADARRSYLFQAATMASCPYAGLRYSIVVLACLWPGGDVVGGEDVCG